MNPPLQSCFHCGEPVPADCTITVEVDAEQLPVCCHGCKAVAEFIQAGNLSQYYRYRDSNSARVDEDSLQRMDDWLAFDDREAYWGETTADGKRSLPVLIEGLHCAACIWLLRTALVKKKGVQEVQIDLSSGFARIIWSPDKIKLSEVMQTMQLLGYSPHLMSEDRNVDLMRKVRNKAVTRLLVAGLGMMQVMTYSVALYAGEFTDIAPNMLRFLEGISFLVATPVVFYSGQTFFQGAWNSLKVRRPGMDLPVAIALILAWSASVYNYLRGEGALYFDSVVMFVFFLLVARFLEFSLRRKSADLGNALSRLLPEIAYRISLVNTPAETRGETRGQETRGQAIDYSAKPVAVPIADLCNEDILQIPKGHTVPVDGEILEGQSLLDESFLSGESLPRAVNVGASVLAGSVNLGDPLIIRATACGDATTINALGRTLLDAQLQKPKVAEQADQIASWFVSAVLLIAFGAWLSWQFIDPAHAFEVALATLVVTCPCALSLATPAALAAASRRLMKAGLVIIKANAIESLARIKRVVFDKTGTLTRGILVLHKTRLYRQNWDEKQLLGIASALERRSEHPLASAFADIDAGNFAPESLRIYAGQGIEGRIDGELYRLGEAGFVAELNQSTDISAASSEKITQDSPGIEILLGDGQGLIGAIVLSDEVRVEASSVVQQLTEVGLCTQIISGDAKSEVNRIAEQLHIKFWQARQLPEDKLNTIRKLQQQGDVVLMVGDGVNDAPVLAGADVSIAMGSATHLAKSSADFIVTANSLQTIVEAYAIARKTSRIIKQNLGWALLYNLLAIPLAVSGMLAPWMAVIGMSFSSLVVIMNASRIARGKSQL